MVYIVASIREPHAYDFARLFVALNRVETAYAPEDVVRMVLQLPSGEFDKAPFRVGRPTDARMAPK